MSSSAGPSIAASRGFDIDAVRADFPILGEQVYGKPLVYLDNAASAQKPRQVIERLTRTVPFVWQQRKDNNDSALRWIVCPKVAPPAEAC